MPPEQRGDVSRAAGWIALVVLQRGRVIGIWSAVDGTPVVDLFTASSVPDRALAAEMVRLRALSSAMPSMTGDEVAGP